MTDSCGMDVRREAFDETGHLSFSQFDYLDRYRAGAGSPLLTKPGCHIASRPNATKIGRRRGGVAAQGRFTLLAGAHCGAAGSLWVEDYFDRHEVGRLGFWMRPARYDAMLVNHDIAPSSHPQSVGE
ncbi:hypothetical protein [Burkholderia ubonensis]|uniref:hypothetical protein n=1 Tax=Burkholderia ubonensis TaxID=101571 RepID=UPI0012FAC957|nr:hypothetical protein [Burkholderia ubonensis]